MSTPLIRPTELSVSIAHMYGSAPGFALVLQGRRLLLAANEQDYHFHMRRLLAHLPAYSAERRVFVHKTNRRKK